MSKQCKCINLNITFTYFSTIFYTHLFFYFRIYEYNNFSYFGGYKEDNKHGKGEQEWVDGSREIAYWVDYYICNRKEGAAKYYDKNGNEEDRFYKDGKLVKQ